MKTLYCVICSKYRTFEKHKISYLLVLLLFALSVRMKMKNYLKKNDQLRYKKFLVWF